MKKHELFFDNFFANYHLLADLAERNIIAIGTVRENRALGASGKMKSIKEIKKSERGTFDFCSGRIAYFCKWNDNFIVNIATNFTSHIPTETVKCRVKKKADARVTQPKLIKQYNLEMRVVDVMDRLLGTYRPMIRGKKWYWPLVINAINVSLVAAWRIHCNAVVSPLTHLEFCREIAIWLLKSPMEERTKVTGGTLLGLSKDIRFDHINHYKITITEGRCKICQKNAQYKCQKCNVRLHSDKGAVCFDLYHGNS